MLLSTAIYNSIQIIGRSNAARLNGAKHNVEGGRLADFKKDNHIVCLFYTLACPFIAESGAGMSLKPRNLVSILALAGSLVLNSNLRRGMPDLRSVVNTSFPTGMMYEASTSVANNWLNKTIKCLQAEFWPPLA